METYDTIVVGAGAAGLMAAITSAQHNKRVLLLEQLPTIGAKLKATGGGRCNLSNTLENSEFMKRFGKNGRFMTQALDALNHKDLINFFKNIGVETHIPDGFRIFPTTHNSSTILNALTKRLQELHVELLCSTKVQELLVKDNHIVGTKTDKESFQSLHVIVATGGLGYPILGASGDGYEFATSIGHSVTELYPAMMPLITKERAFSTCKAHTIPSATIKVNIPKYKKLKATGDLIFTSNGIRGPVVLDFSRELTPLLKKFKEVPILINMTKGLNEDEILKMFKSSEAPNVIEQLSSILPSSISHAICTLSEADPTLKFNKQNGKVRDSLVKNIAWTPLHVVSHDGFKKAMITRGGISLKEIDPNTMQSKIVKGLYFCGEIIDIDGPCGGYNLQWSFSSGYLAGTSTCKVSKENLK
ncbi:MAG: NAD(P)/FAD-dependent oxidoreductase [Campylobacterota bacterium]|nr:NAD(P)/FAD-dependent oxidoreductase [Campylobacterota bacterium]